MASVTQEWMRKNAWVKPKDFSIDEMNLFIEIYSTGSLTQQEAIDCIKNLRIETHEQKPSEAIIDTGDKLK